MNLTIPQGDAKTLNVVCKDESGTIIDLTGYSVLWKLVKIPTVSANQYGQIPTEVLSKTVGTGITMSDAQAQAGAFQINLTTLDTKDLQGQYDHEAKIQDPAGNRFTVFTGQINFTRSYVK